MLIKNKTPLDVGENAVTDEALYHNRRDFMKLAAALAGASAIAGAAKASVLGGALPTYQDRLLSSLRYVSGANDLSPMITQESAATGYNNFYEFGTGKSNPKKNAGTLRPKPWSVMVEGHADRIGTFALEDIIDFNALEERIYRLRCVETWAMVIPWIGVPLSAVLQRFHPTSAAKFVRFETLADPKQMPNLRSPVLAWPYVEGLRMDEAMHPLTLMAVGMYGKELPNQNGAPMRLVVPWKYGFKSIKSIVKIQFVDRQPTSSWTKSAQREYGFYSNVNPNVDHPRWSQKYEQPIGGFRRVKTRMFNGYADEVAGLYVGMNLTRKY